jgi:hypothetical protein
MTHIKRVAWVGVGVISLGLILCLCGNSFSTQWQSIDDGTWSGTHSASGLGYRTLGNMSLLLGFVVLAGAAWAWLNAKEQEAVDLRAP